MEALGFDHALADDAKAALAALRGALLRRLLSSGGGRKDPDLAISEDAVHVEQEQLDFFGAGGGGGFGHGGDSSIFSSVSGINIDSTICYTVAILKLEREGVSPCRLPARSNTRARRSGCPRRCMRRQRQL